MRTKNFLFPMLLLSFAIISHAQDNTQAGLPDGAIARLGKGGINLMRFSPDGTQLAVGTDVGVWMYNVPDAKETALFTGEAGQVNALAFSPDGKILASGGNNNPRIQLWDSKTYTKLDALRFDEMKTDIMLDVAFDQQTLIGLHSIGKIAYWDVNSGTRLTKSTAVGFYNAAAFLSDGRLLAVAERNNKISIWHPAIGDRLATLEGHKDIRVLALSPDGKLLATATENNNGVTVWNLQTNTEMITFRGHLSYVTAIAFSPDSQTLATADANKTIKLWDIIKHRARATLTGHKNTINALAFAPSETPGYGTCLASGSADGTIKFWNIETRKEITTFATGHTEWIKALTFSKNGATLTTAAYNGIVTVWSLPSRQEIFTFTHAHSDGTEAVALSPNAKFLVTQPYGGAIAFNPYGSGQRGTYRTYNPQVWNLMTGKPLAILPLDMSFSDATAAFSPDSSLIAVGKRFSLRAWHIDTGTQAFWLNIKHRQEVIGKLQFSADGTKLAVNTPVGPQVWDVTTRKNITPNISKDYKAFALSPDGKMLATGSKHGLSLWNLDDPQQLVSFPIKLFGIRQSLTFSPDGQTLIASEMESFKLIDIKSGDILADITAHTEPIETFVFSHDHKILATGSEDGTVLLWEWEKIAGR